MTEHQKPLALGEQLVQALQDGPIDGLELCSRLGVDIADVAPHIVRLIDEGIVGRVTRILGPETRSDLFLRETSEPDKRRINPFH